PGNGPGTQLGEQVPTSVGIVQGRYGGLAQQGTHHLRGLVALHGDADPRFDLTRLRVGSQSYRVADNDSGLFETFDPVADGRARDLERFGEVRHTRARIDSQ